MKQRSQTVLAMTFLAALFVAGAAARADTVFLTGKPPYEGQILEINERGLLLRWKVSRSNRYFPYNEIDRLQVDSMDNLNSAEELLAGKQYKQAINEYEKAKLRSQQKWMRDYVNARLVKCFGETSQFSRAVKTYIELCQGDSALLPWVELPPAGPKGSPDNDVALKDIERVLAATPTLPNAQKLKELRLNILLISGNPNDVLREVEGQLDSPDPEHQAQMRLRHIELLISLGKIAEARKSLEIAQKGVEDKYPPLDARYEPELLFFEGQALYAEKDYLHAALRFMRLPVHYSKSKKALAAEALYWAAKCMQESQSVPPREVAVPLQEAVEKFPDTEGAVRAEKMLKELSSGS